MQVVFFWGGAVYQSKSLSLISLKNRLIAREAEMEKDLLPASPLPKWPQHSGSSHIKARSLEFLLGLPHEWQNI